MPTFSIDYSALDTRINKRYYKLSDIAHRLEKVAFDIVRFKDSNDADELWQIQQADDGQYIVARYDEEAAEIVEKTASIHTWEVLVNKASGDVSVFYKSNPVAKFSATKLGVPVSDLDTLTHFLPKQLNTNKELVKALLDNLSKTEKYQLLRTYPELV
jgi:hypothetical protein